MIFKLSRINLFNKINIKLTCLLLLFIYLCWPSRFAMFHYENYDSDDIYDNLLKKVSKNLSSTKNHGKQCVSYI